ncbi:hypothetical protein, partial [Altererythrobacter sp.]|uniref:hypothetical protein n=1 Tax=Altererythrobacter sp. TaxID=1872480 RepID=UPI003D0BC5EB
GMLRMPLSFLVLFLTAGCEVKSSATPPNAEILEPVNDQLPAVRPPTTWTACAQEGDQTYDGNHWWGWLTLCSGDLRVEFRADSVDLGGPNLSANAYTKECFTNGEVAASYGNFEQNFFFKTSRDQYDEVKNVIRETVSKIGPGCGGPFDPEILLDPLLERQFNDFADRYWRNLSKSELSTALTAQRVGQ